MKRYLVLISCLLFAWQLYAQMLNPIKWEIRGEQKSDTTYEVQYSASIEAGWHLYAMQLPSGGPRPTQVHYESLEHAWTEGDVQVSKGATESYDENFAMTLSWYESEVTFRQRFRIEEGYVITGYVEYMGCNDMSCLPPSQEPFAFGTKQEAAAAGSSATPMFVADESHKLWWKPVVEELRSYDSFEVAESSSPLWITFLKGLLGGLIALLTPCVWPIIPMTVSFFLKRSKSRRQAVRDAMLFGASIVFIYLFLGIIITLLFGASALNSLATNALFNLFFFALLVVFACSFFGAFEITLPSSWTTKIDAKSEQATGVLSILLMAFTLSLVSFSCTGPIIGTLLVDVSLNGSLMGPVAGMGGFALALALPFTLFALFPTWLKSLPKSGGWLNSVKVVLGFLELAFALKFFSVADLAYGWHLMDREVFLVLWIVIFASLGFYLLGKIRFAHDSDLSHISVTRYMLSLVAFAFALYLVPGLWGAPLKAVSAFAPPLTTQDFNLYNNEVHAKFDNYEQGMQYAKTRNLPVVVDFSGYGCVNCRKMESAVWTDSQVASLLSDEYVLITLYVDDKTPLPSPITIEEQGRERTLRTVGDRNSYLQRYKFGANAQPYYVLLDGDGNPLAGAYSFDEDASRFVEYLNLGLKNYNDR